MPVPMMTNAAVDIYYEYHHHDDALPVILLSHGYSATAKMWQAQIAGLQQVANIIVWDMRGHGRSASPDDQAQYSEALTVSDMRALLAICGVKKAIIGGLSLGGYMALAFHYVHPEMCQALMLFDTGPGYKSEAGREGWNRTAEARAVDLETRGLAALGTGAEVQIAEHKTATGLARAARGMLAQKDDRIIQSLPGIAVPTLVLVGDRDEPFLVPTDYIVAKVPGAHKVVIKDAGHASNIDQPAAFNAAVVSFVKSFG
jgi:pimeloyl-ACP methyl ester carboxylesterase